jgi:hypothetical protein
MEKERGRTSKGKYNKIDMHLKNENVIDFIG